jgi:hypothetical protein
VGHVAAAQTARAIAPEDATVPPPGQCGRAGRVQKNGLGSKLEEIAAAHPQARIQLWCEDEARIGQKGRVCHRWYERGVRPPGPADQRFDSLYLFAACRPATDEAFALALPEAATASMSLFLAHLAQALAPGVHAALILDRAGWHLAHGLSVPDNITLIPLPPCSPELKPIERVWLYLRERFLSHRVLGSYTALLDAACRAWNALAAEQGRLTSLTSYPYLIRSELP